MVVVAPVPVPDQKVDHTGPEQLRGVHAMPGVLLELLEELIGLHDVPGSGEAAGPVGPVVGTLLGQHEHPRELPPERPQAGVVGDDREGGLRVEHAHRLQETRDDRSPRGMEGGHLILDDPLQNRPLEILELHRRLVHGAEDVPTSTPGVEMQRPGGHPSAEAIRRHSTPVREEIDHGDRDRSGPDVAISRTEEGAVGTARLVQGPWRDRHAVGTHRRRRRDLCRRREGGPPEERDARQTRFEEAACARRPPRSCHDHVPLVCPWVRGVRGFIA